MSIGRRLPIALIIAAVAFSAWLALPSCADELAERGRAIFKQNQHAVVTVQVVQKMKFSMPGLGAQANESKQDITGTVVDPSGLVVLALSSCEPADMLQNMMAALGGGGGDDDVAKLKMDVELSDVKILLDSGTELPAEVVLRDRDLDLAFIRPKAKPATPMIAVDLSKSARADVLDHVVTLNRLGSPAGRAYAVSVERISAVVQKPRVFYIPATSMGSTALGSPAFSLDGNLLGVFVMRSIRSRGGGGGGGFSAMLNFHPEEGLTTIILPAGDILKASKQAPEAKGDDEKKPEAKNSKEEK